MTILAGDTELDYVPNATDSSNRVASMAAVQAVVSAVAPPIGAQMPYSGVGDPPEAGLGVWVVADGRLIDRSTYQTFYVRTGHAYNLGVDPGSNKVRIPDKRGLKSIGALDFGTGAATASGTRVSTVRGRYYGETNHTLSVGEAPSHDHSGVTALPDTNHQHSVSGSTGAEASGHTHAVATSGLNIMVHSGVATGEYAVTPATPGASAALNYATPSTGTENSAHVHNMSFESGTVSAWHRHAIAAQGGSGAHNNVDPSQADCWIVRIA